MVIKEGKLEQGLDLIHEVLRLKEIPEDLRLKLVEWRTDIQWEIDQIGRV